MVLFCLWSSHTKYNKDLSRSVVMMQRIWKVWNFICPLGPLLLDQSQIVPSFKKQLTKFLLSLLQYLCYGYIMCRMDIIHWWIYSIHILCSINNFDCGFFKGKINSCLGKLWFDYWPSVNSPNVPWLSSVTKAKDGSTEYMGVPPLDYQYSTI